MTKARPGPVSMATLRSQDLLEAFASTLEDLSYENGDADKYGDLITEAYDIASQIEQLDPADLGEHNVPPEELASEVIDDLVDALNNYADEGYYFGGHPGDGAEFGFYPVDEDDF